MAYASTVMHKVWLNSGLVKLILFAPMRGIFTGGDPDVAVPNLVMCRGVVCHA
jgi:hypothetical protein